MSLTKTEDLEDSTRTTPLPRGRKRFKKKNYLDKTPGIKNSRGWRMEGHRILRERRKRTKEGFYAIYFDTMAFPDVSDGVFP